jgi:putative transposase
MSNLTIKIKHNTDLLDKLKKAVLVAKYAIRNRYNLSSKHVSDIGLPSAISNQILRKYGKNKKCKKINPDKIKLVAPSQSISIIDNIIKIIPLKLNLTNSSKYQITKINQIELDNIYAYVCFDYVDQPIIQPDGYIGVDLNATGHCAVVATPSGKITKLGKQAPHIHKKYKNLRSKLQKNKQYKKLKQTKNKESRKVKDINHKISKKIVQIAKDNNCGIKLEKLTNIRKNKKNSKSFRYTLNSWSYYQLGQMIFYKAQLQGIPVQYIDPSYTSQNCSRCDHIGNRNDKSFRCANCKHIDHADANAAFNIAKSSKLIDPDKTEIIRNGCTDKPKEQCCVGRTTSITLEPPMLQLGE